MTRRRDQTGQVVAEAAVLFPALLVFVFLVLQVALASVATSVADAAAWQGVQAGRAEHAPPDAATAAAQAFLAHPPGAFLDHPRVTTTRTSGVVSVVITGDALSLLPGRHPVTASAHGPIEHYTQP